MVAVGAPLASIGCYSVPQQSGSVASPAAILRVAPSIDSLVELRGRVYASSKWSCGRMALCVVHVELLLHARSHCVLAAIVTSGLSRLAEGYFVLKNEASLRHYLLVPCDASCLCGRAWFLSPLQLQEIALSAQNSSRTCCRRACELSPSLRHV